MAFGSSISKESNKAVPLESIQSNYQELSYQPQEIKPVILFIVDEYNSPDNLFELTKDSSIHNFNNWLNNKDDNKIILESLSKLRKRRQQLIEIYFF